ncbi:hypothetical protein [Oceanicoccus sagamiensis]|uniref:2TM domain-containing protein n=1 Tax=Oceanicoccus sagamiensis TaxID=716816 RepID=A0A1X9NHQ9_9GAMM|nr:hypothetical protein [Oceanicoccus sagamiensis]ARN73523.1 hypothetical protein BST96_04950 [Oceanicoccus sagamiensis]
MIEEDVPVLKDESSSTVSGNKDALRKVLDDEALSAEEALRLKAYKINKKLYIGMLFLLVAYSIYYWFFDFSSLLEFAPVVCFLVVIWVEACCLKRRISQL